MHVNHGLGRGLVTTCSWPLTRDFESRLRGCLVLVPLQCGRPHTVRVRLHERREVMEFLKEC